MLCRWWAAAAGRTCPAPCRTSGRTGVRARRGGGGTGGAGPSMKPPSGDGGNRYRRSHPARNNHSLNEATIWRWWKLRHPIDALGRIWTLNEATIWRWWKRSSVRVTSSRKSRPLNEATIWRWWKLIGHGRKVSPRTWTLNEATIWRWRKPTPLPRSTRPVSSALNEATISVVLLSDIRIILSLL